MAFPAFKAAYDDDPLKAAIETVRIAANTFGLGREREFIAELRAAFPVLRR